MWIHTSAYTAHQMCLLCYDDAGVPAFCTSSRLPLAHHAFFDYSSAGIFLSPSIGRLKLHSGFQVSVCKALCQEAHSDSQVDSVTPGVFGGDSEPTLTDVFLAIFVAYQMASSGDQGLWHHLHTSIPRIYHKALSLEGAECSLST